VVFAVSSFKKVSQDEFCTNPGNSISREFAEIDG
jgi:hypothetical protein